MPTFNHWLLGLAVLTTLGLSALSGCGGGSTPSLIVSDNLPHKDAYAITLIAYNDPCADLGPGQGCSNVVYPQLDYRISELQINNQGVVVHDYGGPAAYWQNGQNITIGLLGGRYAESRAVNDAGQIVGGTDTNKVSYAAGDVSKQFPSYASQAFVWHNGTFTNLGALPSLPDADSQALAINNNSQVAGYAYGAASPHAVLWQNGTITDLDTGQQTGSLAYGINIAGQVVGINGPHAALWNNGNFTDLGALPNQQGSFAVSINDKA